MPRLPLLIASFVLLAPQLAAHAEDWREFRGPTGQGHYDGKNLPIEWIDQEAQLCSYSGRPS